MEIKLTLKMLLIVIIWEMELTFNQIRTKKPLDHERHTVYVVSTVT